MAWQDFRRSFSWGYYLISWTPASRKKQLLSARISLSTQQKLAPIQSFYYPVHILKHGLFLNEPYLPLEPCNSSISILTCREATQVIGFPSSCIRFSSHRQLKARKSEPYVIDYFKSEVRFDIRGCLESVVASESAKGPLSPLGYRAVGLLLVLLFMWWINFRD